MNEEIQPVIEDEKIEEAVDEVVDEEILDQSNDSEDDPYEAELKRLEADKKKAEDIARQKSGALNEERKKAKALEERLAKLESKTADESSIIERVKAELKQEREIEQLTSNPKEQELIKYYIKNNNLNPKDAWFLANKSSLLSANEAKVDSEELVLARLSGASTSGAENNNSQMFNLAAQGLSEKERKNLKI